MGKYFEKKRGVIWAILTITLFLFIYGGLELIPELRPKDLPFLHFTLVRFILAFIGVIVIGIIIWRLAPIRNECPAKKVPY